MQLGGLLAPWGSLNRVYCDDIYETKQVAGLSVRFALTWRCLWDRALRLYCTER